MTEVVRAGGGIVVRRAGDGRMQVAVVHRPVREDWSFPKGKLEEGETFEEGALREVLEETGLTCRLGRFLGHTQYRDRKDRDKVVAYWVMTVDASSPSSPTRRSTSCGGPISPPPLACSATSATATCWPPSPRRTTPPRSSPERR